MESELGRLVEVLPGFVWTALPDGQIELINQSWSEYTGLEVEASFGRGWQGAVHPEDLSRLLAAWRGVPAARAPVETEVRLRGADGQYRWFSFRAHPLADASGQVVKWCGLSTDIDDRMRAEEALRASERRFRLIVDELPVLLSTATPDGELEQANRHYLEYFGATLEELKARETIHGLHPDDRARVGPVRRVALEAGHPYEIECRRRRADGVYRWFYLRAFPLRDAEGRVALWYRLQTDIDDQKRAEALLAGEKQLLEMVASGHPMSDILEALCRLVEDTTSGCYCSIVLVDPSGAKLQEAIAPSLAPDFNESVRNWPLNRIGGPCLMAARDKVQVIMADVASDTRWRNSWRKLAQAHGLRSCWSTPIVSLAGNVLGTFALYQREPGSPNPLQLELIGHFTHIASIAIERALRDAALRQSEARRAEAERELQLTIDTIPTLVATYRPDGSRIFVNQTWRNYTGLSFEEAVNIGPYTHSILHPDDVPRVDREWRNSLAAGIPFKAEGRLRRADGEYRWHLSRRVPLRDDAGRIIRWYGISIDIEDQKCAEEAQRKSEAQLQEAQRELQLTIDTIPAMVATYEPDGTRTFVNQQWRNYTGRTLEEATGSGRHIMRQFHPDESEGVERAFWNSLAAGEPITLDLRIRRADGEYRWHNHQSVPLRDEQGTILKWYATEVDIEDKKRAESARLHSEARLAEAERELRLTLESIPTITWRAGPNGYVQQLNKRWFEYTGTTPEQSRGARWKSCVHPDDLDRLLDIGRAYVASGTPIDGEARLRRFDGAYRWFLFRPAAAHDETGEIIGWYGIITDIEDRKQAEERAVEAERELQRTINHIPVLVGTYSANGTRLSVNKRALEVTGLSAEDVPGERWRKAYHPDDVAPVESQWGECLARGEPFEREVRTRMADGTYRWHLTRRVPLRDEAGQVIRWYGIGYDIEDQKRAEEAAAASERNLKLTIDTIPAVAWSARPDGSAEFFNQNYLDYVGLSLEQVQDWGWTAAVHPDDLIQLAGTWQALMAAGKAGETEARLRRHDGEYRWFLFRANPLRDQAGNIVKWYGVNTDIEDRKRTEEELRRSEAFLAKGQEASLTGTFSWYSATGEFTWSEQLYRIYEFQPGVHITFELIASRYHPEDRREIEGVAEQARSGVTDFDYTHRLLMSDGSTKYIHVVAHGSPDKAGSGLEYFGAVQDVTQRRLAEAALDKVRSELAHVTRVMSFGALTASIAHEVNQPLAGIVTNASTCLRMLAADPPNVEGARETARRTIRDGNRAADVITRLRALFSKKVTATETIDLNEATREVLTLVFSDLLRNKAALQVELDDDHPLLVTGDRVQLQQVILNLVRNALDAMSDVNDRPRDLLVRASEEEEGGARLIVKDAGVGFEPQGAERLFDAFYTTKSGGMGIGLSVSRSIIESHGGKLWAEQNDGPGATFSFSIPRQTENATHAGADEAAWPPDIKDLHGVTRNTGW
jgi:PAS domain S-box-containing protein